MRWLHDARSRQVLNCLTAKAFHKITNRANLLPYPTIINAGWRLQSSAAYSASEQTQWIGHGVEDGVKGRAEGRAEARVGAGVLAVIVGGGQIWDDRSGADKRARTQATQDATKRRKLDGEDDGLPIYATKFTQEEIEAEEKKPKRKVAVMLGYSGSGYKGMQLNHEYKTIEGDLFSAFVAAGAISKANADDPKKSSLVRCARTDRGVHAAGNIISLKMIIEDADIVKKINDNLSPQIRVWGIERTNGSFSAYQLCDSRVYEYLIPTYCFLPPHPESFFSKELVRLAEEAGDLAGYEERQKEVANFWKETEETYIQPHLATLDPELAASVRKKLYDTESETIDLQSAVETAGSTEVDGESKDQVSSERGAVNSTPNAGTSDCQTVAASETHDPKDLSKEENPSSDPGKDLSSKPDSAAKTTQEPIRRTQPSALELALRTLKNVIISAKKAHRIHPSRLARVQSILDQYIGTQNFHNYTIAKGPRDPSAKRVIKSFTVAPDPILINNTEWLSLKVHGQSFMMHQIRKMVTMAALIVRSGCPKERMRESYGMEKLTIPKAPSLGLLLERPVFDTYNTKIKDKDVEGRGEIGFEAYREEMEEFKQREIYERIFREEERDDTFHSFFASLDSIRVPDLLYLSSAGIPAAKKERLQGANEHGRKLVDDEDSEEGGGGGEEQG
ncbi:MAG: hypothetical protein Q9174_005858 [Haloplaca sp. 1 TL-2023]